MKNYAHIVLVFMASLWVSQEVYANPLDSNYTLQKKHFLLKIDVFSPIKNCLSVSIEKDLGKAHSLELGFGFFKGESDPDYLKVNGVISGAFIRLGPKYYFNKNNFRYSIVKKSVNSGYYIRPEMVAQYSFLNQPRDYTTLPNSTFNAVGNETHEYVCFGTILNFGCQFELGKRIVLDGFVGLGMTYLIESVRQSASPYYFATIENTYGTPINPSSRGVGLGSQAGMKLGVKLF
ncbi:MAG: hypothetical protein SGJ00_13310 [bacterium]|nr:hypothetical protein [bacterium]